VSMNPENGALWGNRTLGGAIGDPNPPPDGLDIHIHPRICVCRAGDTYCEAWDCEQPKRREAQFPTKARP